jgi:hypothetical protein
MLEFKAVLDLIKDFLSPASKLDQPSLNQISLETILNSIIDQFSSKHYDFISNITPETTDSYWKFGLLSLELIKALDSSSLPITNDQSNYSLLSITEERQVVMLCQLVVSFGVHLNLEDDVGISVDRLSKFGANIRLRRESVEAKLRNVRLDKVIEALWDVKREKRKPELDLINRYFYRKCPHDLICALVQLSYSPNSISSIDENNRAEYRHWLEVDIFEDMDGANLVSALLMAQSG